MLHVDHRFECPYRVAVQIMQRPTRKVMSALYVLLSFAHIDCRSIYIIYTSAVVYTNVVQARYASIAPASGNGLGVLGTSSFKAQAPGISECDGMYTMLGDDES